MGGEPVRARVVAVGAIELSWQNADLHETKNETNDICVHYERMVMYEFERTDYVDVVY